MSKEMDELATILKGWGPSMQRSIDKAKGGKGGGGGHGGWSRWPAGAPNSKGGQFAPAKAGGGSGGSKAPSLFGSWSKKPNSGIKPVNAPQFGIGKVPSLLAGAASWHDAFSGPPPQPKPAPPGAKPHPKVDDNGKPVTINWPSKASKPESWTDPQKVATFTPGSEAPAKLNGVPLKAWTDHPRSASEWANVPGQNPRLDDADPIIPPPGKSVGSGVIIQEADGRVWLTKPTNEFGGYKHTFPKGTVEHGLSLQASAIKETYEETGLKIRITGVLGDYERTTSVARVYIAQRVGGTPSDMGWESQAVRLAPVSALKSMLNQPVDKDIVDDWRHENLLKGSSMSLIRDLAKGGQSEEVRGLIWLLKAGAKPAGKPGKPGHWQRQKRWPAGTPLGGQWKAMGRDGLTMPPSIAGGLGGKNSGYQKKVNALHLSAQAGNLKSVVDGAILLEKKVNSQAAAGMKSSHAKWTAQTSQYATQLVSDLLAKPKAEAAATKISGPAKLSEFTKVGGKPGGSNPGGVYTKEGEKYLVKGNLQLQNGAVTKGMSDDRAHNEVLATKLMQAAGIKAPDMEIVDLGKEYGGGLGVAVKWIDGAEPFNKNLGYHKQAIQEQYAVHAWLGNYDVLGQGYDNTVMLQGNAINIDPGGAILFRAQGKLKDKFEPDAPEWESMRKTTIEQSAVFGPMTEGALQNSAKQLANISDDTIKKLVDAHGPGDAAAKKKLADTLIKRRDAILEKADLKVIGEDTTSWQTALAKPKPEPPKVAEAVKAPADTPIPASIKKPEFNSGLNSDAYYTALVDKIDALHKAGDVQGLADIVDPKKVGTWGGKTQNSKKLTAYYTAVQQDIISKQQKEADAVAIGAKTVVDQKGKTWRAENGVLNPVDPEASGVPMPTPLSRDAVLALHAAALSQANGTTFKVHTWDDLTNDRNVDEVAKFGIDAMLIAQAATKGHTNIINTLDPKDEATALFKTHVLQALSAMPPANPQATPNVSVPLKGEKPRTEAKPGVKAINVVDAFEHYKAAGGTYNFADFSSAHASSTIGALAQAASLGDDAAVQAVDVYTETHTKFKTSLLAAMYDVGGGSTAGGVKDTAIEPTNPDSAPKTTASPALPNFENYKLSSANSNSPSHNFKVDLIAGYAKQGDVKSILAMNFGTNTYGKQQAKLANDALAALGSVHQVQAGQKKFSHPALVDGSYQKPEPAVAAAIPSGKTSSAPGTKPKPIHRIPKQPDFENWNGPGNGLSSIAAINKSNSDVVNKIKELGDKLDLKALGEVTFQQFDKNTGQFTGKYLPVTSHPSQHIKAYLEDVIDAVKNPYVPEAAMTPEQLASIPAMVQKLATMHGDIKKLKDAKVRIGRYAVLGSVSEKPFEGFPPKTISQKQGNAPVSALYKESNHKFDKLSSVEKQAIKDYTGGSYHSMNSSIVADNPNDKAGKAISGMKKAAVQLPTGLVLSRKFTFPEHHSLNVQRLVEAQGSVIKEFGIISTSTSTSVWSGDVHLKITAAPGAKGLFVGYGPNGAKSISQNPGENEIILPFGSRFYVKKVETKLNNSSKKVSKTDSSGNWATSASTYVELVLLPDLE